MATDESGHVLSSGKSLALRYEALRAEYLVSDQRRTDGRGLGLALFLSTGMLAWMAAWSKIAETEESVPPSSQESIGPIEVKDQLLNLLVVMAMNHNTGEQPC